MSKTTAVVGAGLEEPRFGWSLVIALIVEAAVIGAVILARPAETLKKVAPTTVSVHMIEPAGPPKAIPLPPQPVQPPKPVALPPPPKPAQPPPEAPKQPPLPKPPPAEAVPRPKPPTEPRHKRRHVHRHVHHAPQHQPRRQRTVDKARAQPARPQRAPPAKQRAALPPTKQQVDNALSRYTGIMRGIILGNVHVPEALRSLGASGTALVRFEVAPDGSIQWVKVVKASSYRAATRAARTAVRVSHFPGFLSAMPRRPMVFEIRIHVAGAG